MPNINFTPGKWEIGLRTDDSMWFALGDPKTGPHYQGDLVCSEDDAKLILHARELYLCLKVAIQDLDDKPEIQKYCQEVIDGIELTKCIH